MFNGRNKVTVNIQRVVGVVAIIIVLLLVFKLVGPSKSIDNVVSYQTRSIQSAPHNDNVEVISWRPRILLYKGFLTQEECEHIIKLGDPHVQRSKVGTKAVVSDYRTSFGTFFVKEGKEDPILQSIAERIELWTQLPKENGEAFYFLRYENGQEYKAHVDYFNEQSKSALKNGGNRIATVVMYLSDVEEGGETVFPKAEGGKISVKPRQGDAILFWDFTPEGKPDELTLHAALPVKKGVKYAMTRWIRQRARTN